MEDLLRSSNIYNKTDFDKIQISIASPEVIYSWSYGEVKKPETINYRTLKPERDGLFCAKIFGPIQNYSCLCGKYKRLKHRGVVCERCGVEVTLASVRRERMAHINLASPVVHIWFLRSLPSRIGLLLDMTLRDLEKILYFETNVVIDGGMTKFETGTIVRDQEYKEIFAEYGDEVLVDSGASAIRKLLAQLDIEVEILKIQNMITHTTSDMKLVKLNKRLKLLEAFKKSGNKPEWMVLTVLPVIAPDLRPLVPLEGGRFATSDLNECYKKVINRNNRLKRLIDLKAPDIILRNEKRMLQEAVDALFDNGKSGRVVTGSNKRPLKSLADGIKGKHGRFRQNLLGKRVDYSGRSVITVGPTLKLYQCGLPKRMALELFRPFIYGALQQYGYAPTIKAARRIFEEELDIVWDLLEKIIHQHPILLNRAPTLHRLSVQAFEPKLIEGKAIQLHPLVCSAFNADFDGDSMAVHIPITLEAQIEARVLMFPTNNILLPANGDPIVIPTQDIVLGLYYISLAKNGVRGEGKFFLDMEDVKRSYDTNSVDVHAKIKVRLSDNSIIDTVVGRALLYSILPEGLPFELINRVLHKKTINEIVVFCYNQLGSKATVIFVDQLMYAGYKYCTQSGSSISLKDMIIPHDKSEILNEAEIMVDKITSQFENGLLTNEERYSKIIDIWTNVLDKLGKKMMENIANDKQGSHQEFNPLYMMCDSGARGSIAQLRQIGGMRGLMIKPNGSIIETPITANLREGLTVLQYFNSTHGARKGLADTALRTATAGYLTRRLVDAAQDLIIKSHDCHTKKGIQMVTLVKGGSVITSLEKRILGRVNVEDINLSDGSIIPSNTLLDEKLVARISSSNIDQLSVRSPMTCEERRGICAQCYGSDLSRNKLVDIGEAVGIIAAQSIGEPGTQLTMRTFHSGGTSSGAASESQIVTNNIGRIVFINIKSIRNRNQDLVVLSRSGVLSLFDDNGRECERHKVPFGAILKIENHERVQIGTIVASFDPHVQPIIAEVDGYISFVNMHEGISYKEQVDSLTGLSSKRIIYAPSRGDVESSPTIHIVEDMTATTKNIKKSYVLQVGSIINLEAGMLVMAGDILAYIPIEISKAKDIVGGLPRIAEIFEARVPKDSAILAPIDGTIIFGKETKDKRRLIIKGQDNQDVVEILVPKWRSINLMKGESVKAGEVLVEGHINPHDTLKFRGVEALASTMVNELQEVYRLQGISINDKHIETIIRTILRKVSIVSAPDNIFLPGDQIDLVTVLEKNEELAKQNKPLIVYERILLGITKSALSTESFLSAASFQETTRILTEAAVNGEIDHLRGLKENVLIGRLIPAGTGMAYRRYKNKELYVSEAEQGYTTLDELL